MTDKEQCEIFSQSERGYIRNLFIESLTNNISLRGTILNLGCGPCDYDVEISKQNPNTNIIAVDASSAMCDIADQNVVGYPITVVRSLFKDINYKVDITVSSLTLHHQSDPLEFWSIIKNNTKENGDIFVMDLIRPNNLEDIDAIVNQLAGKEDSSFVNDFKNSLAAAYTLEEIQDQLKDSNLALVSEAVGKLGIIVLIYGKNI
jgi:SAM-dependent methyltransferase